MKASSRLAYRPRGLTVCESVLHSGCIPAAWLATPRPCAFLV